MAYPNVSVSASGNVFSNSSLAEYANSIVSKPTVFAFAKGIGLMGEKIGSPGEAIMPLSRLSNGDLGVKGSASNVSINVVNQASGDGYEATAVATENGNGLNIEVMVTKAVRNDLRNNGPVTQAISQTFGLSRKAH